MRSVILACVLAVAVPAGLSAQGSKLDFQLVNKTTLTISEVYVSPTADDEWGDDVMGSDVLEDSQAVDIVFSPKSKDCIWDLKIVDEDEDEVTWTKLDLCKASQITLMYQNGKPTAIVK